MDQRIERRMDRRMERRIDRRSVRRMERWMDRRSVRRIVRWMDGWIIVEVQHGGGMKLLDPDSSFLSMTLPLPLLCLSTLSGNYVSLYSSLSLSLSLPCSLLLSLTLYHFFSEMSQVIIISVTTNCIYFRTIKFYPKVDN